MSKRNRQRRPIIGGSPPPDDQTKQGRRRRAKRDVAEMAAIARKELKLPSDKEVREVERSKEE